MSESSGCFQWRLGNAKTCVEIDSAPTSVDRAMQCIPSFLPKEVFKLDEKTSAAFTARRQVTIAGDYIGNTPTLLFIPNLNLSTMRFDWAGSMAVILYRK